MESFELETYITKAKNGDKESIYILIEYFAPYIYKIIKNYHINGNEISDLYQVSCIAIMKAIQKYNSNSNTFKSYVYRAIFNEVCYLARSNKKHNNCVSYHALINDSENEFSEILLQDKMSIEQFIHDENMWTAEQTKLTKKDQMEEFMFLGLRMMEGVSLEEFEKQFGKSMLEIYGNKLAKLEKQGLLEKKEDSGRYALTKTGIDVSNQVFVEFLL